MKFFSYYFNYSIFFNTPTQEFPIQKRDGLDIVTSNDCDWSI